MTKKSNAYTAQDIKVLSDRDHVRLRTSIYFGSMNAETFRVPVFSDAGFEIKDVTFVPAMLKAYGEIVDNAVDELTKFGSGVGRIDITYEKGTITVADNGRGVPIEKHSVGQYTPEVVFSQLRSGRNFDDSDKTVGVIGMNGVGSSCTNMCSTSFRVTIRRDGKVYTQAFTDGCGTIGKPSIKAASGTKTGTEISFKLDPAVFGDEELPEEVIRNRAYEIALTNPSFHVTYNGTKIKFKHGLADIVPKGSYRFTGTGPDDTEMDFFAIPDGHDGAAARVYTWANSSLLYGGGIVNTQFVNALVDTVTEHFASAAKKQKIELTAGDIEKGLLVFSSIKLKRPEYDSQSKIRLAGPKTLRKPIDNIIAEHWPTFKRKNKDWLDAVFQRAHDRYHKKANKTAIDDHRKAGHRVDGLLDATSTDRQKCMLFITEGDSAKATITSARTPEFHASLPLGGKLNNVFDATPAQVLQMGKIKDLLAAIGLTPGLRADPMTMRYGYIVLACDADTDGAHIVTLLVQLFYKFWPELFDKKNPRIFRLMTPNVVAIKGDTRVHFSTQAEYAAVADKYKNYTIKYYKGLGSLNHADWDMVMKDLSKSCQVFYDDGNLKDTLRLHFSGDVEARRAWLMEAADNE